MNILRRYPQLGSSVDPEKLSSTLKSLIPLVVLIGVKFGLDIEATDIDNLITTSFVAVNAVMTAYYAGRRIYIKIKG